MDFFLQSVDGICDMSVYEPDYSYGRHRLNQAQSCIIQLSAPPKKFPYPAALMLSINLPSPSSRIVRSMVRGGMSWMLLW